MDLATQILVIIVSVVLTLFLIIGIVVMLMIAKLIKEVKKVLAKAEDMAENASHITELFKNVSGPLAAITLIRNIMQKAKK